jgi:hypothetical protein
MRNARPGRVSSMLGIASALGIPRKIKTGGRYHAVPLDELLLQISGGKVFQWGGLMMTMIKMRNDNEFT